MSAGDAAQRAAERMLGEVTDPPMSLQGGCVHDVFHVRTVAGSGVMKVAACERRAVLEGERAGLHAIDDTGTVRVPRAIGFEECGRHVVLGLEWLEPGEHGTADWVRFGEQLASMHARGGHSRYGFTNDNHVGLTEQRNTWCDDWVEFTATCRLSPQLAMARDSGHMSSAEVDRVERIIQHLDRFIPRDPEVSLLHGDLWSGNAMPLADGTVSVIDPSCSYGDAWCDLAMMRLFGGFPSACESAWRAQRSETDTVARLAVYQLYHQLNHLNLFGSGYLGGVLETVARLE